MGNKKYAVFGHIRSLQQEYFGNESNPYYTIPALVIYLCLSYFHCIDCFDDTKCSENVEISGDNNDTITQIKAHETVPFNSRVLSVTTCYCKNWINSMESKIIKWKFKINKLHKYNKIYITKDDKNKKMMDISRGYWSYSGSGMIEMNGRWSGSAYGYEQDDEVEIILDLIKHKLMYEINGKYRDTISDNMPRDTNTKYKLAIDLYNVGDSVTLIGYSEDYVIAN